MLSRPYTHEPTPQTDLPSTSIVGCLLIQKTHDPSDETFCRPSLFSDTSSFPNQKDFKDHVHQLEGFEIYNAIQKTHHIFEKKKTGKVHLWTFEEEHLLKHLNPTYDPLSLTSLFFVERKKSCKNAPSWTFQELIFLGEKHKIHFSTPVSVLFEMYKRDGAYNFFNKDETKLISKVVAVLERIQSIYGLQELEGLMARVFPPVPSLFSLKEDSKES